MSKIVAAIIATLALTIIVGCVQRREAPAPSPPPTDLERLAEWMTGSFSSQAQAANDSDYYDIRLLMAPIWSDRNDGPWLYVEQAVAGSLEKPYRQRVYHLSQDDDSTFRSVVYTMKEPLRFVGLNEPDRLGRLTPDSLTVRGGCDITLRLEGDSAFVGSTVEQSCESTRAGANYATAEVRITEHWLTSWDRGFDSTDVQVWGAEKGGYIFHKLAPASRR